MLRRLLLRSFAWRFAGLFALGPLLAAAGVPSPYGALVVEPVMNAGHAEFDLNPALARARREGKWLYVYLGASDCPYCRKYEAFLAQNATELVPHFAKKYLVVDLRSALSVTSKSLSSSSARTCCRMQTSRRASATNVRACWSTRACGCSTAHRSR